ncbi:MAG: hypothetical protein R2713_21995 [Ilumatobacteraceae bacterium]
MAESTGRCRRDNPIAGGSSHELLEQRPPVAHVALLGGAPTDREPQRASGRRAPCA